jgi:hypothetical protein
VIDAMDEYQNIDQHQVDKVFEQVADVTPGSKRFDRLQDQWTRHCRMVDTRVCCDPPETWREACSHALKIGIRLGTLVTLRKQKNKEMKRPALCLGMPTRLPHCGGRSMDPQPGGQQSSCATRSDPCPQIVRLYAKASEPRMERK